MAFNIKNFLKRVGLLMAFGHFHVAYAEDAFVDITIPHNDYSQTPVIEVYIGDHGPYNFVIDTGATNSSISRELADEIGLSYREQTSERTIRAKDVVFYDIIDSVNLYISNQKVLRQTYLFVNDHDFSEATKARGILGVSQFQNGVLENHPDQRALQLTIPKMAEPCENLNKALSCNDNSSKLKTVKFSLGPYDGDLILDTGFSGSKAIGLFKSDPNNYLWNKYHHDLPELIWESISDKPLRLIRTPNFTLNGKPCLGELFLRDPKDLAPKLDQTAGFLGWNVLDSIPFKLDYKNDHVSFDINTCPYVNEKTIGISGVYYSKDFQYMYIDDFIAGSPADKVGLKRHDQVEKIILANGKVITKFDHTLFNYNDQHVYAPVGSKVTYFVRRDDVLKPFVMTAEGAPLIELE